MEKILQLETIREHNDYIGVETRHPLVNVVEGSKIGHPIPHARKRVGMYVVFLKELKCTDNLTYGRQFITRKKANKDILTHFEELLDGYFTSDNPKHLGTPTVAWCADQLHLSPNYFGDLIKKETGKPAREYVQQKTMDAAKDMLTQTDKTISEIAYCLGYQYPQYFSRAFRNVQV